MHPTARSCQLLLGDGVGIGQWMVSNCIVHHLASFLSISVCLCLFTTVIIINIIGICIISFSIFSFIIIFYFVSITKLFLC